MELKLIEKEKTSIKVEIVHPDDTLIYPLVSALLKDDDVADAQYITGHPQLDKPVLFVKTQKGDAQAAIHRAASPRSAAVSRRPSKWAALIASTVCERLALLISTYSFLLFTTQSRISGRSI